MDLITSDASVLAGVATVERVRLIRQLREVGPCTVTRLAQVLKRPRPNVSADAGYLRACGLLQRGEDGLLRAPEFLRLSIRI